MGAPFIKMDLRWCALLVFLFGFVMATYFVVRLTSSNSAQLNTQLQLVTYSNHSNRLLLVLIHASGESIELRNTIRNTWVSPKLLQKLTKRTKQAADYRFVLGVKDVPSGLLDNLKKEALLHGDMILLPDVTDSHQSLTLRTLRSFQYVTRDKGMEGFRYILKCDDDSFADLLSISKALSQRTSNTGVFWGHFLGAGGIITEGPYSEFNWSVCETYLPYALGGGYILSMDLVKLLARNAPFLKVYNNEDVSVGAWLAPYNIDFVSDSKFNTGAKTKGCKKQFTLIHRVNTTMIQNYFHALMESDYICTRKNRWFVWHGYKYNWKTKPSRCCRVKRGVP